MVRQGLLAMDTAEQLRTWRTVESAEKVDSVLLLLLLGLLTSAVSLFTCVWCHPSFYVSLLLTGFSARHLFPTVVPANLIVLGVYRHFAGPVAWQDLYNCAVVSLFWFVVKFARGTVTWEIFEESLAQKQDLKMLAEKQSVFHRMLTSVFDAWCFCDADGVIRSSTPQLDVLLDAPGSSPKEDSLCGLSLLELAIDEDERRRAHSFLASTAGSDTTVKITLRLNRRNSTAHQVEVSLSAIRLGHQACAHLTGGSLGAPGCCRGAAAEGETLFVAVQVLEAEPLCAVVDSESNERPPAELPQTRLETVVGSTAPPAELSAGSAGGGSDRLAPALTLRSLAQTGRRATRVKNTFVEAAESVIDSVFGEVLAGREPCALSAPGSFAHCGKADDSPASRRSSRSPASLRSRASRTSRHSRRSARSAWSHGSLPSARRTALQSLASGCSECADSSASEASEEGLGREVVLSCPVQDRGRLGSRAAAAARLGPALAARRGCLPSIGSAGHGAGRCYPCLMEAWQHAGKAAVPCKFGLLCGRCHENHSEEQLRELRKQQRRQRAPKVARGRAQ